MNLDDARSVVLLALGRVAPEADLSAIDPSADLRDELDIDSMDLLNVMLDIHAETGIDVPEEDYGQLDTLDRAAEYLVAKSR